MQKEINFLTSNDVCPTCNQEITEEFKNQNVDQNNKKIDKLNDALIDIDSKLNGLNETLQKRTSIQKYQSSSKQNQ